MVSMSLLFLCVALSRGYVLLSVINSTKAYFGSSVRYCNQKNELFVSSSDSIEVYAIDGAKQALSASISAPLVDGYTVSGFGASFSVSSSCARVAVSAPTSSNANYSSVGLIFVFDFAGSEWNCTSVITLPDKGNNTLFGQQLALYGDSVAASATFSSTEYNLSLANALYAIELSTNSIFGPLQPYDIITSVSYLTSFVFLNSSAILVFASSAQFSDPQGFVFKRSEYVWFNSGTLKSQLNSAITGVSLYTKTASSAESSIIIGHSGSNGRISAISYFNNNGTEPALKKASTLSSGSYSAICWLCAPIFAGFLEGGSFDTYSIIGNSIVSLSSISSSAYANKLGPSIASNSDCSAIFVGSNSSEGFVAIFSSDDSSNGGLSQVMIIVIAVCSSIVVVSASFIIGCLLWRRRRNSFQAIKDEANEVMLDSP